MDSIISFSENNQLLVIAVLPAVLSFLLLIVSFFLSPRKKDEEFESPYECGFDPFIEAQIPFEVKFYLISILFIVFDLEISFILPWVVSFEYIGLSGFFSINLFLIILILGYFVEWAKKALD